MALLLSACASAGAPDATDARPMPSAAAAAASPADDPDHPDRSCRVDSDCAVKNVGSCCGNYPKCVNRNAATDPSAVRARCGQEHRMGVCIVPAVSGCSCVMGQCADINAVDARRH
jgi:hypothetical protein